MRKAKVCPKCEVYRPLSEFGRDSKSRDGLKSWCKYCCHTDAVRYRLKIWEEDPWLLQAYAMLHSKEAPPISVPNARRLRGMFPEDMCCPVFGVPFQLGVTKPTLANYGRGTGKRTPRNPYVPSLEHVLLKGMEGYHDWDNLRIISLKANTMLNASTPADMYTAADWRYNEWKKRGFDKHGNHTSIRHRSERPAAGADDDMATDHSGGDS